MVFKYDTKKINNKHYIYCVRLKSEFDKPDNILEFDKPFDKPLTDKNGKLQWRVERKDGETIFIQDPLPLTPEEQAGKRKQQIRTKIHENYRLDEEIKLINLAIETLAETGKLPKEYLTYRQKIKEIKGAKYELFKSDFVSPRYGE